MVEFNVFNPSQQRALAKPVERKKGAKPKPPPPPSLPLSDASASHREWVLKNSSLLSQVPAELTPGTRHGQYSYTCVSESGARIEILLRDMAYYVKEVGPGGQLPDGSRRVRWDLHGNAHATWSQLRARVAW